LPRFNPKGGWREGRNGLDGISITGEKQEKEMLNTEQCFLSVNLHNQACASTAPLLSGL